MNGLCQNLLVSWTAFANVSRSAEWPFAIFAGVWHLDNLYRLPSMTGGAVWNV
jgi:hypothetical protein